MNPCIRCQFVIENRQNVMNSKCGHPDLQVFNVVTGPEGELWAYDDAFPPAQEWEE
jgi:hypothetical protein